MRRHCSMLLRGASFQRASGSLLDADARDRKGGLVDVQLREFASAAVAVSREVRRLLEGRRRKSGAGGDGDATSVSSQGESKGVRSTGVGLFQGGVKTASTQSDVEHVKLSKVCAEKGLCSAREAEDFIDLGLVSLDGGTVRRNVLVPRIDSSAASVALLPRAQRIQASKMTVLLNKPLYYASCDAKQGQPLARHLLKREHRDPGMTTREDPGRAKKLHVCGKLDVLSSGLLVFSQDGRIATLLNDAGGPIEFEYEVLFSFVGTFRSEVLSLLCHGLSLDGEDLLPCEVELLELHQGGEHREAREVGRDSSGEGGKEGERKGGFSFAGAEWRETVSTVGAGEGEGQGLLRVVTRENRRDQLRRMLGLAGLEARRVHRKRIGQIECETLPMGKWRLLRPDETFL
uniref:Pseudouridine synthase RsuA/RluA-like domain-containing protein n=1 Tax=Chromera velia CCMP2878 TaxID=1169474 RepID=A0A0G4G1S0_9ALVE|eukprot:Cvel_4055.t1-p1 / transcript=Cvel_4055.t1 / gene=Cvel_4055 / organism=Chromera_velia_CCMP2878 / gene_product=Uncharacterized RNA pseudouridine synthase ML1370, putative / transcript_product=Uncharacterized RNA pseudouridine synthase ML1370, putative / location=Cvel_scaffold172:112449-114776(+) / protein_length=402 / sequence_SO=supercontig / SO=protein_coding / is_pseudo=false